MQRDKRLIKHYLLVILLGFMMTSCGYKPSSHYIKEIFSDTVYVEVDVDRVEPENAVYVKDEMNRLVYRRFKGKIVSKEEAQSQIRIVYKGTRFRSLTYDEKGFTTRYRADIRVRFTMLTKQGEIKKSISSRVESDIEASSLRSSKLRTEAIREGLAKALDEFLAYVSIKGAMVDKNSNTKMIKNKTSNDNISTHSSKIKR